MHLKEITLRNWRSYRAAVFKFPEPSGKKRVVLIGAMNGTGKTSLLMALYLGLFGREAMHYIEGVRLSSRDDEQVRSYRQLMKRILHRPSLEDDDPHAFVQMSFGNDDDCITISRTWYYRRGGDLRDPDSPDGEEVRIDNNGRVQSFRNWQEANNQISELLFPPHVAPCFFFDGEQAQARVESSGGRALADAVTTLFGTGILSQLNESLRTYIQNKNNQIRPDVRDVREDELAQKRQRHDEIDTELSRICKELDTVRAEHEAAEVARKAKVSSLHQLIGDAGVDLQRLAQQRNDLQRREIELSRDLREQLVRLSLPIAARKLGQSIADRIASEVIRDKWLIIREDATAKAESIIQKALPAEGTNDIIPALIPAQREQLALRFRAALEMLWSPPPQRCASEYRYSFLTAGDRTSVLTKMKTCQKISGEEVAKFATEWGSTKTRLRELDRKWDALKDLTPKLEQLKQEIKEAEEIVGARANAKIQLETLERSLQTELKDLKAAIGQMEGKKRQLDPVHERLDVAYRVREVIETTREKLIPLCREAVEEHCTKHFREMISGEYRNYKVTFDTDYQPMLTGPKPTPIYITTLSGAQKRAFGLAFTLAVAEVTGESAPLVIDTPVGNMDSEYRLRILTYLAKAAPGQVIFLSHDEEISREYAEALKPYTAAEYLIAFDTMADGSGISTVLPNRYFAYAAA